MTEEKEPEKAGRIKVSFYLPDYVYNNFITRLGMGGVKDKQITTGAVNAMVKLFALHFATGKAGLNIHFEPKPEDLKKVA